MAKRSTDVSTTYALREQPAHVHLAQIQDRLQQIKDYLKRTVAAALEIGERLTYVKEQLPHGEFTDWCYDNLPDYSIRTLQRYMLLHGMRDKIDIDGNLSDAYKVLLSGSESAKALPAASSESTPKVLSPQRITIIEAEQYALHFDEFIEAGMSRNRKQKYGMAKGKHGLQPAIIHDGKYHVFAWDALVEQIK
ncbi:MAG: DUF3102 domain-containing protein [Candidatus Kapabacteria bacterium]|nr:DUF3102 domain-containing protein [Candidatus Kapabacteria bacterium]